MEQIKNSLQSGALENKLGFVHAVSSRISSVK